MKPKLSIVSHTQLSDALLARLREGAARIGAQAVSIDGVHSAQFVPEPPSFRDQAALALMTSPDLDATLFPDVFAVKVFDIADAMEAERLKRMPK